MPDWIWIQNVVFPILGMGMGVLVMVGVYRIVNKWLDRRHERAMANVGGAAGPEIERLASRVEALEDNAYRIQELEERVDFAERLLAQQQERNRLPGA